MRTVIGCIMAVGIGLLAACAPQAAPTATPEPTPDNRPAGQIILGDISDEPTDTIEAFQPLADYLAANLGDYGIGIGSVKAAPDIETMTEWLKAGEVSLYFDSLYPALIVSEESGGQPILRRWKDGVEEYHSVIFALAGGGIETVADLRGEMIAFDDVFSTSGYMLPRAFLTEAGMKLHEYPDPDNRPNSDEVGYVFSSDDDNTIQWVISGRVAAGVTDNIAFSEIPEETRAQLAILAETEDLPRHVAVVSPALSDEVVSTITTLLLGVHEAEGGAAILETFEDTARFDEFPQGRETALERMRELYAIVNGE
ncbi:MAG: phosphate/phosphite/phosphonate ABC transporter substrate-binding protein [Anaerolineae bacterium]|nr:phosphate/phosphite/phosphonate ABC transporter substrate-binding protein [Anaerolineae bacterium]